MAERREGNLKELGLDVVKWSGIIGGLLHLLNGVASGAIAGGVLAASAHYLKAKK